jgi:hypothetical protein
MKRWKMEVFKIENRKSELRNMGSVPNYKSMREEDNE